MKGDECQEMVAPQVQGNNPLRGNLANSLLGVADVRQHFAVLLLHLNGRQRSPLVTMPQACQTRGKQYDSMTLGGWWGDQA